MASNNGRTSAQRRSRRVKTRLVQDAAEFIGLYVIVTDAQRIVIALWAIHTHLVQHVEQTPYLSITSPDPECGKSRLLEVLHELVARPWMAVRPSEAVAYRNINDRRPTLLLDEVDTLFSPRQEGQHEGLRAILDAGHRRGATVPRAADFGKRVEEFSPFCAKALAGIGSLPDSVARRSVYVRLQRKRKDEEVARFKRRDVAPVAAALRERMAAWAKSNGKRIGVARPDMPQDLSDRMEESCEVLVAIADACGCGDTARAALVELLAGGSRLDTHDAFRVRLLKDLRDVWADRERADGRRVRAISTADLLTALHAIEDGPWQRFYGRPFEANDLASLLRQYNVAPTTVKVRGRAIKGYKRDAMFDVFERYVGNAGNGGNGDLREGA